MDENAPITCLRTRLLLVSRAGSSTTGQVQLAKVSCQVLRPALPCQSWGCFKVVSVEITHVGSRSSRHRGHQGYSFLSRPGRRRQCTVDPGRQSESSSRGLSEAGQGVSLDRNSPACPGRRAGQLRSPCHLQRGK